MSVEATNWVWKHSRSRGAARLVLLAIADFGNDNHQAWPSMQTLATKTALGERTVHRAIAQLMKMGELRIEYNAGPKLCNLYQVVLTPANLTPPSERHPRQSGTPANLTPPPSDPAGGAIHDTQGVPIWHPEPSVEPSGNHQPLTPLSVVPTDDRDPADILDVWDTWKRSTGKQRADLNPARRRAITKALDAYPTDDVLDAVQGWVNDPWPERAQHNDITQLLHMGTQRKPLNVLEKMRDLWRHGRPVTAGRRTRELAENAHGLRHLVEQLEGGTTDGTPRMGTPRQAGQRQLPGPAG